MAMEFVSTTHWDRQDFDSSEAVLLLISLIPNKTHPTKCSCFICFPQLFEFQIIA